MRLAILDIYISESNASDSFNWFESLQFVTIATVVTDFLLLIFRIPPVFAIKFKHKPNHRLQYPRASRYKTD